MKKSVFVVIIGMLWFLLSGCTATLPLFHKSMQVDTFKAIKAEGYLPREIRLYDDVSNGINEVLWKAEVPNGKHYQCSYATGDTVAHCIEINPLKPIPYRDDEKESAVETSKKVADTTSVTTPKKKSAASNGKKKTGKKVSVKPLAQ